MDTGANISVMSDAEANALGLAAYRVDTTMGDISGSKTSLQVVLVHDLFVGKTHLKHVGFVVLPHTQSPFDDVPVDKQALLGIQVLRSLGSIGVDHTGNIEIGERKMTGTFSKMTFYDNTPVVQMASSGQDFTWTFDTGAQHTTLNHSFAVAFPELVEKGEKKDYKLTVSREVHSNSRWNSRACNSLSRGRRSSSPLLVCFSMRQPAQAPGLLATSATTSSSRQPHSQ